MRVLVACEFSGRVRQAFRSRGHDAYSCDLLPAEDESPHHFQCDVRELRDWGFDLMIAHPPCTYLAASGARWWAEREHEQTEALDFVHWLSLATAIPRIAIENPIGRLSTAWRKPDQIVQPWWFGDGETKATCLWLKGLPLLKADRIVSGRTERVHRMGETRDRWRHRSRTPLGMARAMAEQWGNAQCTAEAELLADACGESR